MSFGKMNGFADIKSITTTKDSEGFETTVETTVASVRCYREGRHGSQRWVNLSHFSDCTDLFRIRKIPDVTITTSYFIYFEGERFDIVSVEDVKGRKMYIEILAKKVESTVG